MEGALEPYFIKALNLLHSKAKDSTEQLKAMLDEALRQRAAGITNTGKLLAPLLTKKDSVIRDSPVLFRREESEKRLFDKLKDEDVPLSKRQRMDSPKPVASPKDDETLARIKGKLDSPKSSLPSSPARQSPLASAPASPMLNSIKKNEDSDSLDNTDDLALEIMDLHCVVCNGLDVTSGNQLVECQECHDLYHQECHRPAISDADVNDPRVVWYCLTCSKLMKKTSGKPNSGPSKPGSNRESPVPGKSSGSSSKRRSDSPNITKQGINVKSGSSSSSSSSSSKSGSSKSGTPGRDNGNSKGSTQVPATAPATGSTGSSILSAADKRLQIMKKKAATKLQEKRKPAK